MATVVVIVALVIVVVLTPPLSVNVDVADVVVVLSVVEQLASACLGIGWG